MAAISEQTGQTKVLEDKRAADREETIFTELLTLPNAEQASDFYLIEGQDIYIRINGELKNTGRMASTRLLAYLVQKTLMEHEQKAFQEKSIDIDFSWSFADRRFRGNAYHAGGQPAIVLRQLPNTIPELRTIQPLAAWHRLFSLSHGLILVCGPTGSGKSTTIAAFIEELAKHTPRHILTLEDPVEYIFTKETSLISQREFGRDFFSFEAGLRSALREMPDILLVGEIRDKETMRAALMAAESGSLVLSTLHTMGAAEALLRMDGFFAENERDAIRSQAAAVLQSIFSQELLPAKSGGRVSLTEVLLRTPATTNLIRQGKYMQLTSSMISGSALGMQTREMALDALYRSGKITEAVYREQKRGETI